MATMGAYPGSTAVPPSGTVIVAAVTGGSLQVSATLQGLPPNTRAGIHIHEGTTCASVDGVGGHYWTPPTDPDPWNAVTWRSNAVGAAIIDVTVHSGFPLSVNYGHAVVVHGAGGERIGCGILMPTTTPPTLSPSASPTSAPTVLDSESSESSDSSGVNLWLAIGLPVLLTAAIVSAFIVCGGEVYLRRKYPQHVTMHPAYSNNPAYDTAEIRNEYTTTRTSLEPGGVTRVTVDTPTSTEGAAGVTEA